jgi:hypothetical protein
MKQARLYIVLGFRGALLRDTLAKTAKEAKIRCVNDLWRSHPEYEREGIRWSEIEKWGWRCVPVTLSFKTPKRRPHMKGK